MGNGEIRRLIVDPFCAKVEEFWMASQVEWLLFPRPGNHDLPITSARFLLSGESRQFVGNAGWRQ